MGTIRKVAVAVLVLLGCAAWAGDRVTVEVVGEYTDTGTGHRMLYAGTVDFTWTAEAAGGGTPEWAYTGFLAIEVMDAATGARYHYFGGCVDCIPLDEGRRVEIERQVLLFGCGCAPRFTGSVTLGLEGRSGASIPLVTSFAMVGR